MTKMHYYSKYAHGSAMILELCESKLKVMKKVIKFDKNRT